MTKQFFYLLLPTVFLLSCSKVKDIPSSSFSFDFITATDQSLFDRDDAISQNTRGLVGSRGFQVVAAATAGANNVAGGLQFKFEINSEDEFSTSEFLSLFKEGSSFDLGPWNDGNSIYFGHKIEDVITPYTATTNESNILKIISGPEHIGENEDGEDFYRLDVTFSAELNDDENESDIVQIENGQATLYVVDFSSE